MRPSDSIDRSDLGLVPKDELSAHQKYQITCHKRDRVKMSASME